MKVASGSAAAAAGPSCALKAGKTAGGAGEVVRCLSEQSVAISRCAGGAGARLPALLDEQQVNVLLYDMNGCYSRLKELVPTLPQNRKVSRVEILQHVIDYIWDLELELNSESQVGTPGGRGLPARAPLSTLNGEISALAAEVRSELERGNIFFLQMGKLRPKGRRWGGYLALRPSHPFGHLAMQGCPRRSEKALSHSVSWGRACSLVPSEPPVSPLFFTGGMCPGGRSHLVSLKRLSQGLADPSPPGGEKNSCSDPAERLAGAGEEQD
ncbi:PREDICTED: DNA-binding protein inhibitor ID-1 isoform 1 [Odobenus rosmarus divergens]|uniref:DNA-binding protein inhibitor ID-3 n=1 Tax=Odobenus rosmarus divergens TaxID=9708 RepID=A0A9B0G5I3_ODORO